MVLGDTLALECRNEIPDPAQPHIITWVYHVDEDHIEVLQECSASGMCIVEEGQEEYVTEDPEVSFTWDFRCEVL